MASIIIMPKQGLLMEEGTIIRWLVPEGGSVVKGEPLFEMETDKLTITIGSEASGTVLRILHGEGDVVGITRPIAIVGEPGEDISALLAESASGAPLPEPDSPQDRGEKEITGEQPPAKGKRGVFATPRARLFAQKNGVELNNVTGSGESGLIRERDVAAYKASAVPETAPQEKTDADAGDKHVRKEHVLPMTDMRRDICERMLLSKKTNAQTHHCAAVDMSEAEQVCEQFARCGIDAECSDVVIMACARALKEMPVVNASMSADESSLILHEQINIGIDVFFEGGMSVPNIKNADVMPLADIAAARSMLAEKAKQGTLSAGDCLNGTFSVAFFGEYGADGSVAIINVPESAILAVGRTQKKPVVITDKQNREAVEMKKVCELCLSYDHRIIDGADAADFLQLIKKYLQNPLLML